MFPKISGNYVNLEMGEGEVLKAENRSSREKTFT